MPPERGGAGTASPALGGAPQGRAALSSSTSPWDGLPASGAGLGALRGAVEAEPLLRCVGWCPPPPGFVSFLEPWNTAVLGNGVICGVAKARSQGSRAGSPSSRTGVGHTDAQGVMPRGDAAGGGSDASASQGPPGAPAGGPQQGRGGRGTDPPPEPPEGPVLPTPRPQTPASRPADEERLSGKAARSCHFTAQPEEAAVPT